MTPLINERPAIKDDVENRVSLPEIGTQRQLLLIYESSAELYAAGLKGRIIEFLLSYEVKVGHIEVHMNSSLYFRVNTPFTDIMLRKLADDFEEFISQLEKEFKGRIFWLFNTVAQLKLDEPQSVRAAMLGKGNKTVHDEVEKEIKKIPVVIREIKETPAVTSEIKEIPVAIPDARENLSEEKAFVLKVMVQKIVGVFLKNNCYYSNVDQKRTLALLESN